MQVFNSSILDSEHIADKKNHQCVLYFLYFFIMSLKTKANVISFYSYQLSTVFNVSVDKNEEAEMMLSNDESKVTVIFSV